MRFALVLGVGLLALTAPAYVYVSAAPASSHTVCAGEPGAGFDLRARLVNLIEAGSMVRVVIDLAVRTDRDLAAGLVQGRLRRITDGDLVQDLPGRSVFLLRGKRVVLNYDLDLSSGEDYQLTFSLINPERPQELPLSSTTVRINLDPERKPQELETRLQFRARMQGR